VTPEIARIRGIPEGEDSLSPNRHPEITNIDQLLDMVLRVREVTGKPVGIKTAIGGWQFMNLLTEAVARRGIGDAPDFIAVDGGEGGSGAAPQALADHMSLSIEEALPRVVDALIEAGIKERVKVMAAGTTGDLGAGRLGAGLRCRFRQQRARLHVRAGLHPGPALPYQHLPDRHHDAQRAPAARPGGRRESSSGWPITA
jgi:hypothetical protein